MRLTTTVPLLLTSKPVTIISNFSIIIIQKYKLNASPHLNIDKPDSEGGSLWRGQAELARRARRWRGPHQRQRQRSPRAAVAAQL